MYHSFKQSVLQLFNFTSDNLVFPNRIKIGSASPLSQRYYKNQQDWQQRHAEGIGLKKRMRL